MSLWSPLRKLQPSKKMVYISVLWRELPTVLRGDSVFRNLSTSEKYLAQIVPARGNPRVLILLAHETPQPHVNRYPKPGLLNNSVLRNHWTSDKSLPGVVPRRVSPQKVGRHRRHTTRQEVVRNDEGDGQSSSAAANALGHFSLTHIKRTWETGGGRAIGSRPEPYWECSSFWPG